MRFLRILRRAAYTILALVLALFLFVQFQQRLLRRRAERLHDEIVALQLHPGTFADIQRMQKEWGRFAHYDGECTQHHCVYEIGFNDPMSRLAHRYLTNELRGGWFSAIQFFGIRNSVVYANVSIHDNREFGADFTVMTLAYPGTGRNNGHPYMVSSSVDSETRLKTVSGETAYDALLQGYMTDYEESCLGCEYSVARVTQQTSAEQILRLNPFNFSCLTRLWGCKHPEDLNPAIRAAPYRDRASSDEEEADASCKIPSSILAREANDILLVKVVAVKPVVYEGATEHGQLATIQVIRAVKNGVLYRTSDRLQFGVPFFAVRPSSDQKRAALMPGQEYFFLYHQHEPESVITSYDLGGCQALQNTAENAESVAAGIGLDPSTGEDRYVEESRDAPRFIVTLLF